MAEGGEQGGGGKQGGERGIGADGWERGGGGGNKVAMSVTEAFFIGKSRGVPTLCLIRLGLHSVFSMLEHVIVEFRAWF